VRLPALPLHFWRELHLRRIRNILGNFLEVDLSFLKTHVKQVARILVNINIREGLLETINLVWGPEVISQILDYENIPFRCRRYHAYGHPISECSLLVRTFFGGRKKSFAKGKPSEPEKGMRSSDSLPSSADECEKEGEGEDRDPSNHGEDAPDV